MPAWNRQGVASKYRVSASRRQKRLEISRRHAQRRRRPKPDGLFTWAPSFRPRVLRDQSRLSHLFKLRPLAQTRPKALREVTQYSTKLGFSNLTGVTDDELE